MLTAKNWGKIAKGALIAISGSVLFTLGSWLTAGDFNLNVLLTSLGSAVGAILVNLGRKVKEEYDSGE